MRGSLVYLLSLRRSVAGDSEQEGFFYFSSFLDAAGWTGPAATHENMVRV